MNCPSVATLVEALGNISVEQAKKIRAIMKDGSFTPEAALDAIDKIIGTHGVEYIAAGHNKKSPAIAYCNAGDPYYSTVLFVNGRFAVCGWGAIVEGGNYD